MTNIRTQIEQNKFNIYPKLSLDTAWYNRKKNYFLGQFLTIFQTGSDLSHT